MLYFTFGVVLGCHFRTTELFCGAPDSPALIRVASVVPLVVTNHAPDRNTAAATRIAVTTFLRFGRVASRIRSTWHTISRMTVMTRTSKIKNHTPPSASGANEGSL